MMKGEGNTLPGAVTARQRLSQSASANSSDSRNASSSSSSSSLRTSVLHSTDHALSLPDDNNNSAAHATSKLPVPLGHTKARFSHSDLQSPSPNNQQRLWATKMNFVHKKSQQTVLHINVANSDGTTSLIRRNNNSTTTSSSDEIISNTLQTGIADWKPYDASKALLNTPSAAQSRRGANTSTITPQSEVTIQQQQQQLQQPTHRKQQSSLNGFVLTPTVVPNTALQQLLEHINAPIKTRNNEFSIYTNAVMTNVWYLAATVVLVLLSLFLKDFETCVMPKAAEIPVSIILTVILFMFMIDIAMGCISQSNYIMSYLFWLDCIGTLSITFDITFFINLGAVIFSLGSSNNGLSRLMQAASIARVFKVARLLRVFRLVRVTRLFTYHSYWQQQQFYRKQRKQEANNGTLSSGNVEGDNHSNRVGLELAELIDKRVIIMMLSLLVCMPLLTTDLTTIPIVSEQLGLNMLNNNQLSTVTQQLIINKYLLYHSDVLLYFAFNGVEIVNNLAVYQRLRANEMLTLYSSGSSNTATGLAIINIQDLQLQQAYYSICVGTYVVAPLERMTMVIKMLMGTLNFLQPAAVTAASNCSVDVDGKIIAAAVPDGNAANETVVIENMIEKLSTIFNVTPNDNSNSSNSGGSKAMQIMAGSKLTEIQTAHSVVSIEVVERAREPSVHMAAVLGYDFMPHTVDLDRYKELSTLPSILSHPLLLSHFKLYMNSCHMSENLKFWQEIDRYKKIMKLHGLRLYHAFVSIKATSPINISSAMRAPVDVAILEADSVNTSVFDSCQKECLHLMRGSHNHFLNSKFCQMWLKSKRDGNLTVIPGGGTIARLDNNKKQQQQQLFMRQYSSKRLLSQPSSMISPVASSNSSSGSNHISSSHAQRSASLHGHQNRLQSINSNTSNHGKNIINSSDLYDDDGLGSASISNTNTINTTAPAGFNTAAATSGNTLQVHTPHKHRRASSDASGSPVHSRSSSNMPTTTATVATSQHPGMPSNKLSSISVNSIIASFRTTLVYDHDNNKHSSNNNNGSICTQNDHDDSSSGIISKFPSKRITDSVAVVPNLLPLGFAIVTTDADTLPSQLPNLEHQLHQALLPLSIDEDSLLLPVAHSPRRSLRAIIIRHKLLKGNSPMMASRAPLFVLPPLQKKISLPTVVSLANSTATQLQEESNALSKPGTSNSLMYPGRSNIAAKPAAHDPSPTTHSLAIKKEQEEQRLAATQAIYMMPANSNIESSSHSITNNSITNSNKDSQASKQKQPQKSFRPDQNHTSSSSNLLGAIELGGNIVSNASSINIISSKLSSSIDHCSRPKPIISDKKRLQMIDDAMDDELSLTYPGWHSLQMSNPAEAKRLRTLHLEAAAAATAVLLLIESPV